MSRSTMSAAVLIAALFLISSANAQVDDVSDATGLPIPIGAPVIYGQVELKNVPRDQQKPLIFVTLLDRGSQVDRVQTNERGYYYFLKNPTNGHTLVFEADGQEVGRVVVSAGISNRVRNDVSLDWNRLRGASRTQTGTISVKDKYDRSEDAEKAFQKAMESVKQNKNEQAIKQFAGITQADAKDFFAWMMLGTLYMTDKKFSEADQAFTKSLEQKPDFTIALVNYGKSQLAQKNYDKAVELLSRAVDLEPNSAEANHMLGEAYLLSKKGSKAVGYLNKAIEIAPVEKADIHLRLAALYNGAGMKDRAALEYKAFLEKKKDHPDAKQFQKYVDENLPKQ